VRHPKQFAVRSGRRLGSIANVCRPQAKRGSVLIHCNIRCHARLVKAFNAIAPTCRVTVWCFLTSTLAQGDAHVQHNLKNNTCETRPPRWVDTCECLWGSRVIVDVRTCCACVLRDFDCRSLCDRRATRCWPVTVVGSVGIPPHHVSVLA
jgi:hypothetical protein